MNFKVRLKNIVDFMEKHYNIFMYIALFIILWYPYNISIREYIIPNDYILLGINLLALAIISILHYKDIKKSINYVKKPFIIFICIVLVLITFRNADIINKHFGMPFFSIITIIMMCILATSKKWYKIAINLILIFTLEHVFATWICYIFPGFYQQNIMPIFPDFKHELMYQLTHGEIAGFTQHYSTNATYIIIGLIVEIFNFKYEELKTNRKKIFLNLLFIVFTFGALLLTGKRTQLFIGVFVIIVVSILKNISNIKNTIKNIIILLILASLIILGLSKLMPSLLTPINRVIEGIKNEDLFSSRDIMYDLAINEYKQNRLFGNGWGTYKYTYNTKVINKEREYMDAHNIYLQMLSEIGIIGISILVGIWIYMIYRAIKHLKERPNNSYICIFLALQIYILLEGIVGNAIYDIPILIPYMLFCGFLFSTINIYNYRIGKEDGTMSQSNCNKILSISVAAYNIENMIKQNLDSFVNSNVKDDIEVIVTDDGSKDTTAQIVEEYEKKYPGIIRLIKQKNAGPGSTVNSGILNATGKYFKMVDGDDWVETENLEEYITYLKNNDVDMVLTNYEIYNNQEQKITGVEKINLPAGEKFNFNDICSRIKTQMHHITFKTEILKNNNVVLDNGFYTDVEYMLLPIPYVKTITYLDTNIYVYRIAQATQSVSIPSMQKNIKMHDLVLNRLIEFYEENKEKLDINKRTYIRNRISIMADTQLGTLLTFEVKEENKNKIKEFNKNLKNKSIEIYNSYKKSKKARMILWSNYTLYKFASNVFVKKLNNI